MTDDIMIRAIVRGMWRDVRRTGGRAYSPKRDFQATKKDGFVEMVPSPSFIKGHTVAYWLRRAAEERRLGWYGEARNKLHYANICNHPYQGELK